MVGTVNNVGQFVGIPLGGYLADRYVTRTEPFIFDAETSEKSSRLSNTNLY